MNNNYCVIMAGGVGSRFWPLSRTARPKQFIDILGTGRSFLQQTYDRFKPLIPNDNFLVVTSVKYKDLVLEQLPELKEEQILLEPIRRNTAPCLAYAAYKIKQRNSKARVVVTPSDHLILKEDEFARQVQNALNFSDHIDSLITMGIKPTRPETHYGYIQIKKKKAFEELENLYTVKTFTEKPNLEMAQIFVDSGEFYWNSGIFIASLSSVLNAFDKHLPDIAQTFKEGEKMLDTSSEEAFIKKAYSESPAISIDYGIMEKAENVYVLTVEFGWSDLGTWGSLYENKEKDAQGNVVEGNNVLLYDTRNCIVEISDKKFAVVQGLDGFIVAESNDTLMICRREDEDQIKKFVTDVKIKRGDSLI